MLSNGVPESRDDITQGTRVEPFERGHGDIVTVPPRREGGPQADPITGNLCTDQPGSR
jgi:hypothetical protein